MSTHRVTYALLLQSRLSGSLTKWSSLLADIASTHLVRLAVGVLVTLGVSLEDTEEVRLGVGRLEPEPVEVRLGLPVGVTLCVMEAGVLVTLGVADMEGMMLLHSSVRR